MVSTDGVVTDTLNEMIYCTFIIGIHCTHNLLFNAIQLICLHCRFCPFFSILNRFWIRFLFVQIDAIVLLKRSRKINHLHIGPIYKSISIQILNLNSMLFHVGLFPICLHQNRRIVRLMFDNAISPDLL